MRYPYCQNEFMGQNGLKNNKGWPIWTSLVFCFAKIADYQFTSQKILVVGRSLPATLL
jgi:hypothetical protein